MELIVLAGGNPLPNYLAVRALEAERVFVLHTNETADTADRLKAALPSVSVEACLVPPYDVSKIVDRVRELNGANVHLHYTGGTKAMACAAAAVIEDPARRSYLVEERGALRLVTDDGAVPSLKEDLLPGLDDVLKLHGRSIAGQKASTSLAAEFLPQVPLDSRLEAVLTNKRDRNRVRRGLQRLDPQEDDAGTRLQQLMERLNGVATVDVDGVLDAANKQQPNDDNFGPAVVRDVVKGWQEVFQWAWLELLTANWLAAAPDAGIRDVRRSVETVRARAGPAEATRFELDVMAVHRHRLLAVSCTTSGAYPGVMGKAAEAMYRAWQCGGDHASVAVVSLLDDGQRDGLRDALASAWGTADPPIQVFGKSAVNHWSERGPDELWAWAVGGAG